MPYKLLATDIDGTITDEEGRIYIPAMEWIRKLEAKGIPVILVSGRPLPFVESLSLYMGTSGPIIAENGAVAKVTGRTVLLGDPEPAKQALELLKTKFEVTLDNDNVYRMVDISLKLNMNPEAIQRCLDEAKVPVSILVTNVMLHLVDNQVSKGKTLMRMLNDLKIEPSETVVIGDSYNDLPLFEIGAYNLAVGNAAEVLKTRAQRIGEQFYGAGFTELISGIFEKFSS